MDSSRCYHCKTPLHKNGKGKPNKLFCCQDHQRAFYRERRTRAAAARPPKKPARYCEREGCAERLERHQKRFCSIACYTRATFEGRDPGVYAGVPTRAQYTAEQAATVRRLVFDAHFSLRATAQKMGFTVGTVTRIIYAVRKQGAVKGGLTP